MKTLYQYFTTFTFTLFALQKVKKTLFLSVLFLPYCAFSSLFVEPYIGGSLLYYQSNKSTLYFGLPSVGAHASYKIASILAAGVDANYSNISPFTSTAHFKKLCKTEQNTSHIGFSNLTVPSICGGKESNHKSYRMAQLGLFASVDLPIIFNAYGSIFYAYAYNDLYMLNGAGVKAGLSYLNLPIIKLSFNLEAQIIHFFSCLSSIDENSCLNDSQSNYPDTLFKILFTISRPFNTSLF